MNIDFTGVKAYLQRNRHTFEKLQKQALKARTPEQQIILSAHAVNYASRNPCGLLNAAALESNLCTIASQHSVPLAEEPEPLSVLHVMTQAYATGGHTRVAERWIQASSQSEKHSVALLSQGNKAIPPLLTTAVQQKNGNIHNIAGFPLEKALALRQLASSYSYIVLYIHMYDPIPVLAFGTEEFKSPVLLFNHADHLMWLGVSVTDLLINFNKIRTPLSLNRRNINRNSHLPLPVAAPDLYISPEQKNHLKEFLQLAPEAKVMLTIGSEYKYTPFAELDFIKTVENILEKAPEAVLLAIGPSPQDPAWRAAEQRSNGRIRALGVIPNSQLGTYLSITDIALESFPLGSPTALLDIARYNIPCVSLAMPTNEYDAFIAAGIACSTPQAYAERVVSFLESSSKTTELYKILVKESLPEGFGRQLAKLQANLPKTHHVWPVQQDVGEDTSTIELFNAYNAMNQYSSLKAKIQKNIRSVCSWYVRSLYPFGLSRSIYNRLNSHGLL